MSQSIDFSKLTHYSIQKFASSHGEDVYFAPCSSRNEETGEEEHWNTLAFGKPGAITFVNFSKPLAEINEEELIQAPQDFTIVDLNEGQVDDEGNVEEPYWLLCKKPSIPKTWHKLHF